MNKLVDISKGVYSTSMRNKPMTVDGYYKQIAIINQQSNDYSNVASLGFYKVGQLLCRARDELKGDWGKLKKKIAEDGLHIKQQERYMKIAENKNIEINYSKLPPQWTFWEKLSTLTDTEFKQIKHMINPDVKWKDVAPLLGMKVNKNPNSGFSTNEKDNCQEVFGLEYNYLVGTKKHQKEFKVFEKELTALSKKYKFIKLKKKNYLSEVKSILDEDRSKTKDDTSTIDTPKFKKQYQTKKKINL